MRGSSRLWLAGPLLAAAACRLEVTNYNAADIERVFSDPEAIETTISSGFQSCHNVAAGSQYVIELLAAAFEGDTSRIPRLPVNATDGTEAYRRFAMGGRLAARALDALNRMVARGGTLGAAGRTVRARAFAYFAIGCHQGWLAMLFDSAAVVVPGRPDQEIPPLAGASEVMLAALEMLDSAIVVASLPAAVGAGGFPLPASWVSLPGGASLTRDDFVRVARSFRARFRAGAARTPTERAQVPWSAVVADAAEGITADFMVAVAPLVGDVGWDPGRNVVATCCIAASPRYYGMADTSGGYEAWLATPAAQRTPFIVRTPDRRWPRGATRSEQQTNSPAPVSFSSRPILAHAATDVAGQATYYQNNRMAYLRSNGNSGSFPVISRAEVALLAAEGHLRLGNVAAAASLIDETRVSRGELPALSGAVTGMGQPVPGGSACVPRVPVPSGGTRCGDIWEALKWEKRLETAFTGFGQWYFDSRGWGDLVEGTAWEMPVPYEELATRLKPPYFLGAGFPSSAPKGTYGF